MIKSDCCVIYFVNTGSEAGKSQDSVGAGVDYYLSLAYDSEQYSTGEVVSFDSDGFTVGGTNAAWNYSGNLYASWNWKAGTTSGLSGGTLTPTAYSINTTSGFGIYQYDGTGATATIAHGLGVAPQFMIVKRTDAAAGWAVYHHQNTTEPATEYLILDTTAATDDDVNLWNDTVPDSTVFTIKSDAKTNNGSGTYMAYVFAAIKGFSSFGAYWGNGDADGPFLYTGFKPAWLLIKRSSGGTADWQLVDNKRLGYNSANYELYPNTPAVQGPGLYIDILSNGFKIIHTSSNVNTDGDEYVYAAFADNPFVNSNGVPGTSRF